jgi:hypothetical protein
VLADLWVFDLDTLKWSFISGSTLNTGPVYGVRNVESASNQPGGRKQSSCWVDASDNIFLFGGSLSPDDNSEVSYDIFHISDIFAQMDQHTVL